MCILDDVGCCLFSKFRDPFRFFFILWRAMCRVFSNIYRPFLIGYFFGLSQKLIQTFTEGLCSFCFCLRFGDGKCHQHSVCLKLGKDWTGVIFDGLCVGVVCFLCRMCGVLWCLIVSKTFLRVAHGASMCVLSAVRDYCAFHSLLWGPTESLCILIHILGECSQRR